MHKDHGAWGGKVAWFLIEDVAERVVDVVVSLPDTFSDFHCFPICQLLQPAVAVVTGWRLVR